MAVCADTTFLIHLLAGTRATAEALARLEQDEEEVCTTVLCLGELLAGTYRLDERERAEAEAIMLRGLGYMRVLVVDDDHAIQFAREYGRLDQYLKSTGADIPDSDKAIIAIGCANGVDRFLTRDSRHFRRVPWITQVMY